MAFCEMVYGQLGAAGRIDALHALHEISPLANGTSGTLPLIAFFSGPSATGQTYPAFDPYFRAALGIAEVAMDDIEMPDEDDDDVANSELAEALVRLCPHLAPEIEHRSGTSAYGRGKLTLH